MSKLPKLVWCAAPIPTGLYRSFQIREWPSACLGDRQGRVLYTVSCTDDKGQRVAYNAARAKEGDHPPLLLRVKKLTGKPNPHWPATPVWHRMNLIPDNMVEIRRIAKAHFELNWGAMLSPEEKAPYV